MKKLLFISNGSSKITNFSIPVIEAGQHLGYQIHMTNPYPLPKEDVDHYHLSVHRLDLVRNPFSFKNFRAYKQMMALLKKEKFDVIHCNTPIGGVLGRLCGKRAQVPKIIYTAHGFHFYKGAPLINRTLFKWAERWMARYTDALITINQEDYQAAHQFKLRNGGTVYYVPGVGVDPLNGDFPSLDKKALKKSLGIKDEDIVLIAMGDLIKRKNYETSIQAIAKAENPKLHFLICGTGPKLDQLKELTRKLGVDDQVHFLGFRDDVDKLLSISDLFLFTSYQEGLPRSMMEAMTAGLPCIASKIRGNSDLIEEGKGGYLYNPEDSTAFANAINLLANHSDLRKKHSEMNRKTMEQFSVEKVKEFMTNIYKKELGEPENEFEGKEMVTG